MVKEEYLLNKKTINRFKSKDNSSKDCSMVEGLYGRSIMDKKPIIIMDPGKREKSMAKAYKEV